MFTKRFWKDATERAISTAAQSLVAVLGVDGLNWLHVDIKGVAATAGGAAILSLLKSIVAAKTVNNSISPGSLITDTPGRHEAPS